MEIPADTASLGLSLQWKPLSATDDVWHILDVVPNSPADLAGLLPYGDYIIGSPEALVKGESGMGELVEQFIDRPLRVWVYNHEYNVTRLVTIQPSRSWGGTGALGCVLGFGALHRIPATLEEPPQQPGETMFETARLSSEQQTGYTDAYSDNVSQQPPHDTDSSHVLLPADMDLPPPPQNSIGSTISPPTTTGPPRKVAHRPARPRAAPSGMDMDDYFKEGEAKSREQDFAPSRSKAGTPVAPPPKTGGPPRAAPVMHEEEVEPKPEPDVAADEEVSAVPDAAPTSSQAET